MPQLPHIDRTEYASALKTLDAASLIAALRELESRLGSPREHPGDADTARDVAQQIRGIMANRFLKVRLAVREITGIEVAA